MALERVKDWSFPQDLDSLEKVQEFLRKWYEELNEESSDRIEDLGTIGISGLTQNSILFAGASSVIDQNNPKFSWVDSTLVLSVDGSAIFNESGADKDFRIEGNSEANLLFVDASTDGVGVKTATPLTDLDIAGSIASRDLTLGSVPFIIANSVFGQSNTNFFWDNNYKILNVGDYNLGSTDAYVDDFDDSSIGNEWTTHNTDADRTIVETTLLTIDIAASTDGRWVSSVNEAPKLYQNVPSPPFEVIIKLPAFALVNNSTSCGVFIGHYTTTSSSGKAYKFHKITAADGGKSIDVDKLGAAETGGTTYTSMDEDAALLLKIDVDVHEDVRFYVSDDDGGSWHQMEKDGSPYAWSGFFTPDMQIGLVATTMSSTNAALTAQFEYFHMNSTAANAVIAESFKLTDSDVSNLLKLRWNEGDTVNRILDLKVEGGNRTLDLYENFKVVDGQDIELHASGGEKAQLAIDTQNAERTLNLSENFIIGNGSNVTITALGQANTFTMNEGFTIGDGNSGTLTYSAASKTLTVESTAIVSQDYTSDSATVQFAKLGLGTAAATELLTVAGNVLLTGTNDQWLKVDSTTRAIFMLDSHDTDAFLNFQEDGTTKWVVGFDYTDSIAFTVSEGAPGTNNRFKIASGGAITADGTLSIGAITVIDGSSINLQEDITFTGATTENLIKMPDNLAVALDITEAANSYLKFVTTDSSESVVFGKTFSGITGSTIGNLTLGDGSIVDSGGSINFGDENLVTTGTLGCGVLTSGNIIIPNAGYIGSVSDTDAFQIEADGDIVMTQDLAVTGTLGITGTVTIPTGLTGVIRADSGALSVEATAVLDADFGSAGLCATNGSGTYSIVADASANWNTAFGWGDHSGANSDITSMSGITGTIATPTNLASKTTAAWTKSIGSGGDYADWATMIADMPDLIAHNVTVIIETGTTLTEVCSIRNKVGIASGVSLKVKAEKYYPGNGTIPTADSATATTLRDAALAAEAYGDDYFNGCWVLICDVGTDNVTGVTIGGAGAGEFKVAGDLTARYLAADVLIVKGSTNNDGIYTISAGGSAHAGGTTTIPVDEAVAAVADGTVQTQGVLDNGFVPITDYVDATGDAVVANWPAAQPIAGDRYIIVGALIDEEVTRNVCFLIMDNSIYIVMTGIGLVNAKRNALQANSNNGAINIFGFGIYNSIRCACYLNYGVFDFIYYSGIVNNNTGNSAIFGGVVNQFNASSIGYCGISNNNQRGVFSAHHSYSNVDSNFGDNNGTWGAYAISSAQILASGVECSGSSGNHSDEGTADTAGADQAAAY